MDVNSLVFDALWQWKLLLYSLLVGVAIGVLFDVMRFSRVMLTAPHGGKYLEKISSTVVFIVSIVEDVLFFVISAVTLVIFVFSANDGSFRGFILLGALVGFTFYLQTVGRLTSLIFFTLSKFLWAVIITVYTKIIMPPVGFIIRILRKIYKNTISRFILFIKEKIKKLKKRCAKAKKAARLSRKRKGILLDEAGAFINTREACNTARVPIYDNHPCKRSAAVQQSGRRAGDAHGSNRRRAGKY